MTIESSSYIGLHPESFLKRIQLDGKFLGQLQVNNFDIRKKIAINPDAYKILEILDRGKTVSECAAELANRFQKEKDMMETVVIQIVQTFVDNGVAQVLSAPPTHQGLVPEVLEFPYDYYLDAFSIELLSTCNLRCLHCYGSFDPTRKEVISKESTIDLLNQLKALHCSDISFTGGEVLLHPDFLDILRYTQKLNFKTSFLTNGTLLTREWVQELKRIGYFEIQVSLDAHVPEVHDAFRGVPGAFDKAFAAIKMLREEGFPTAIGFILNQTNKHCLDPIHEIVRELGVNLRIGPLLKYGNCAVNSDSLYLDHQAFYDIMHDAHLRNPDAEMEQANRDLEADDNLARNSDYIPRCAAGKGKIAVKANGDVIPCEILPVNERFYMGNIYENSIHDISVGYDCEGKLGDLNALALEPCGKCAHVGTCKAGCFAASYSEFGEIDIPDPFTCIRNKVINNEPWP